MYNAFSTVAYSTILACSLMYIWHRLLDKKVNFKDYRLYITMIGIIFISIFNYFIIDKFLKIFLITAVFMIFFRFLFKENLQKVIITPIYYQLIIMVSETLYALVLTILLKENADTLLSSKGGIFLTNVCVAAISILIVKLKFVRKIYKLILTFTDKIRKMQLLTWCFVIIVALCIFPVTIYYNIDFKYLLIFYSSMILICTYIIIYSLRTQNKYNKVSDKYNVAIKSLNDYEDMMTKYRISNHENKNLLLTVRAMILNKEKNIPEYIDSLVQNKYSDDEQLLFKMSVIPSGGLRASIYSEILKIKQNKIDYYLDIDRNIKAAVLVELDTDTIIDICKIIGVFIDNAIEEELKFKKRNIQISLFMEDNKLNVKVTNNYKGKIEIDKIFEEGYTTKGAGHGYGLSLVKKLISNDELLENKIEMTKDLFSQILVIKLKNKK